MLTLTVLVGPWASPYFQGGNRIHEGNDMQFEASKFEYFDERREYVAEASELGVAPGVIPRHITLKDCPEPGMLRCFQLHNADQSGGDIAGWWLREVAGPNCGNDSYKGGRNKVEPFKILIIND